MCSTTSPTRVRCYDLVATIAIVGVNNCILNCCIVVYLGTVDRDKLDEVTRKCVDLQIAHFGQCPYQVMMSAYIAIATDIYTCYM